ncbi:hypothetical protein TRVL_06931 [Trypanosoma vivax]|nr:hypothetical protein TRVL_06931 [Trypanosoma vivax]
MPSFRPVTFTNEWWKQMKRIVEHRVRGCVEDKLQPQQAWFRAARSTMNMLMQVTSPVWHRPDGENTSAVFIGWLRSFDSDDHGCIVKELLSFGVERHLAAWTTCLFHERAAKVRLDNVLTEDISLSCGVPQGSVLGPLLFIVAADSLSKRLDYIHWLHRRFFADDLVVVCANADLREIQQAIYERLDCITNCWAECYVEVCAKGA